MARGLIVAKIDGDLQAILNDRVSEMADAIRAAVQNAAEGLQAELRRQVEAAGLGNGLAKAWRMTMYPRSTRRTLRPAGLVFSKAPRLHDAFNRSGTIRAKGDKWLAIPLKAAIDAGWDRQATRGDRSRGGPIDAKWSNIDAAKAKFGELRFVPLDGGRRALLVAESGGVTRAGRFSAVRRAGAGRSAGRPRISVPLFLLVKQTRMKKVLDIEGASKRAEDRLVTNLSNMTIRN